MRKYLLFTFGLLICSFGDSMNFKAAIGVTPYEAVQQTANYATGIKVGTLAIVTNIIFLVLQFVIKKRITRQMILQFPIVIIQGWLFNVIIYTLFANLTLTYPFRVLFLLGGILLAAIGVGMMVYSDVTMFPLEGFCKALSDKTGWQFSRCRQGADVIFVISCVLVSFAFSYPYAIREGTVLSALLFAPLMKITMNILGKKNEEKTE